MSEIPGNHDVYELYLRKLALEIYLLPWWRFIKRRRLLKELRILAG